MTSTPKSILDLPQRVRIIIYEYTFYHNRSQSLPLDDQEHNSHNVWAPFTYLQVGQPYPKWANAALLGSCQLIRREAQKIFYRSNWFSHCQMLVYSERGEQLKNDWLRWLNVGEEPNYAFHDLRVLQVKLSVAANVAYWMAGVLRQQTLQGEIEVVFELTSQRLCVTVKAWWTSGHSIEWLYLQRPTMKTLGQKIYNVLEKHAKSATRDWEGDVIVTAASELMGWQQDHVFDLREAVEFGDSYFLALARLQPDDVLYYSMAEDTKPPPDWNVEAY